MNSASAYWNEPSSPSPYPGQRVLRSPRALLGPGVCHGPDSESTWKYSAARINVAMFRFGSS
jgi:hypothetical protein